MKKLMSIVWILVFATILLAGCAPRNAEHSGSRLDVEANLDCFSEQALIRDMQTVKDIAFATSGTSDYYILACEDCTEATLASCHDLSTILNKMLGTTNQFEVTTSKKAVGHYISIGDTDAFLEQKFDKSKIVFDGFGVKSDSLGNIYIFATQEGGLSNGIYTVLEDVFGCMFVRDDFDYIPQYVDIYLDKLDIVNNPDFEWRKIFQYEVSENYWFKKLKNNGASSEGVEINSGWGTWCHDVFQFVDPEIYMKEHPDYFVIEDGEPMQLCLTHPDVYPIIERKMAEFIEQQPDKKYWDFSLNDNYNYCKCERCAKVLKQTGSMMGTMLPIINKLAKAFPDKTISTLAYFYNKEVPRGIVCEDNVNIVVAPIGTGQLYSYKSGDVKKAAEAKRLISDWGHVSKSVFVWDYVVDFNHLLLPYPNFDVQKDNHDFYIENNVKAIFHQGSREHTNELACLRSYVLSRQVWDNSVDTNKIIAKYLKVTYGEAATYVARYLDTMNNELRDKANDLDLYDSAEKHAFDYLSNKNIDAYYDLICKAIDAEKDNPQIHRRLDEIKINVLYAKMTAAGLNIFEKQKAFEEFKLLADELDIARHTETRWTMDDFVNVIYPKKLSGIKWGIAGIAVGIPIVIGGLACAIIFIKKRKDKRKQNENITDNE